MTHIKMNKNQIYFIIYRQKRYLSFATLLYLYSEPGCESSVRSQLFRFLNRNKKSIESVTIKNMRVYNFDNLMANTELLSRMNHIDALARAMEED
jgi:hypothetical protein